MVPNSTQKQPKKKKEPNCAKKPKKKGGGAQVSLLLRLGHGRLEATKKVKNKGASSLFVESW
jgi:hypothetical protein